jgi:ABC-type amino acid transport substrate-binding protein
MARLRLEPLTAAGRLTAASPFAALVSLGALGLALVLGAVAPGYPADRPGVGPALARIRQAGVLVVGSDLTFPPFAYMRAGKPVGFDADLAAAVAREVGVRLEVRPAGWDDLFAGLASERFDMAMSGITAAQVRARGAEVAASEPYFETGQGVAVRQGGPPVRSARDLAGWVVGVREDSPGQEALRRVPVKAVRGYPTLGEALTDLGAGRVQAVVGDYHVLRVNARHQKYGVVERVFVGDPEPLVVAVRAGADDLLAVVNGAIAAARRSGDHERLVRKWFGMPAGG